MYYYLHRQSVIINANRRSYFQLFEKNALPKQYYKINVILLIIAHIYSYHYLIMHMVE
jgi:hypothetical protein